MAKAGADLRLIGGAPAADRPKPPGKLGKVGRGLWAEVMGEYEFHDRGSIEVLFQACCAADRAASLRDQIDADGEVIRTKTGLRDHPGLKHELAARAFICRSLARLGLDLEPVRSGPGRPPGIA